MNQAAVVTPFVREYLDGLRWPVDELTRQLEQVGERDGVPIVPVETAQLLWLLVRATRPKHVVEFGTAIGYSTLWMARALEPDARLTTFEIDPDRHRQATDAMAQAKQDGIIEASVNVCLGDARNLMERETGPFDFAFLDATKGEYGEYLELTIERMPPGGVILVDNALMTGSVALGDPGGTHWSPDAIEGQRRFNEQFVGHPNIRGSVLPVGDGLALGIRTS